jgi:hypothetical protein
MERKFQTTEPIVEKVWEADVAFAADYIPSASATAQQKEYRTENVDSSLIKIST